jgi:transposase-like protein
MITSTSYTNEEKSALVREYLGNFQANKSKCCKFAMERGIDDSTFLGWIRKFDTQGIYPRRDKIKPLVAKKQQQQKIVMVGSPAIAGFTPKTVQPCCTISIECCGCTINMGGGFTCEDLKKVLLAAKGVR